MIKCACGKDGFTVELMVDDKETKSICEACFNLEMKRRVEENLKDGRVTRPLFTWREAARVELNEGHTIESKLADQSKVMLMAIQEAMEFNSTSATDIIVDAFPGVFGRRAVLEDMASEQLKKLTNVLIYRLSKYESRESIINFIEDYVTAADMNLNIVSTGFLRDSDIPEELRVEAAKELDPIFKFFSDMIWSLIPGELDDS